MIKLEKARELVFNQDGTINMVAKFEHLSEEVPFTASPDDVEEHGRLIHARALAGEYGEVDEFMPPTPAEIAARDNPPLRRKQMKLAAEQATHWDMMGDAAQAAAWRGYYRELYAMSESPEWPMIELWPTPPDGLG